MAHLAFKKPLQSEKARLKYLNDRDHLRKARDEQRIDITTYQQSKQALLPRNTPSASPPEAAVKKGTILDRGGIAVRLYNDDAKTEEQRAVLKLRTKLEKWELEEAPRDGSFLEAEYGDFVRRASAPTSSRPASKRSSTRGKGFLARIKSNSALSTCGDTQPRIVPEFNFPMEEFQGIGASSSVYSRNRTASDFSGLSSGSARSYTHTTLESCTSESSGGEPVTWADKYVFGAGTAGARSVVSRGTTRRHSFDSGRRSGVGSSRGNLYDDGATILFRTSADDLPYGLTNGCEDGTYTPPSLMLLDIFRESMASFRTTPRLFRFARSEEMSCAGSSIGDWEGSQRGGVHPGKPVLFDAAVEQLRGVVMRQVWFLMSLRWLYFGRVIFSPGHHLLQLGRTGIGGGMGRELRVLDLDGPLTGSWSWQAACEYPDAIIYTLTTSANHAAISPLTAEYAPPSNQRRVQISAHTDLSALPSNSFDVVSSRNLARFVQKGDWLPVLRECYRVLKHDGYIELTVLDPVLNNMGPATRRWILENILFDHPRTYDIMPSKSVLKNLAPAGFGEINKTWMGMPAAGLGDELSTVTSIVGRALYDDLYSSFDGDGDAGDRVDLPDKTRPELGLWSDETVAGEFLQYNTAFRWLKCYARKPDMGTSAPADSESIGNAI